MEREYDPDIFLEEITRHCAKENRRRERFTYDYISTIIKLSLDNALFEQEDQAPMVIDRNQSIIKKKEALPQATSDEILYTIKRFELNGEQACVKQISSFLEKRISEGLSQLRINKLIEMVGKPNGAGTIYKTI